jgi:ferredoxin
LCWAACPEVFDLDDVSGIAQAVVDIVPVELENAVVSASEACPEGAIAVQHDQMV